MVLIVEELSRLFRSLHTGTRRRRHARVAGAGCDVLEARVVLAAAYALTTDNQIVTFDTATPGTTTASVPVSGTGGETLLSLDIRPRDGKIYALGDAGSLFTVNPTTGVATLATTGDVTGFPTSTTAFGTDFNPTVDRLRVINDLDVNLRVNVDTALTTNDTTLSYAFADANVAVNPNAVASGYTNNYFDSTTTTLYNIDSNLDILVRQAPPNLGTLNTVGPLGVDTNFLVGFDIQEASNTAFAALNVAGQSRLYTINLTTGTATLVGNFGSGVAVKGLAVTGETEINRMYRSYNPTFDDHFYTTSEAEFLNARDTYDYDDESSGQSGFGIANAQIAGSSPVYRLYNGSTGIHYYTLSQGERDILVADNLFTSEGIVGYMFQTAEAAVGQTVTPIYHLYNNNSGGHLYTENLGTANAIVAANPGVWEQHSNLGFGFAVGTQYIAPPASAKATAAPEVDAPVAPAESTTPSTSDSSGSSVADSGLIGSSGGTTSVTSATPSSEAAEPELVALGGDSEDGAEVDAVFSTDLGDLLETL
jgi:hypothetical protein